MERGYVKLWRRTLDSGLLQSPTAWQVFGWILLNATRSKRKLIVGGQVFQLEPGDYVASVASLSEALRLSTKQIRTALSLLEKLEILAIKGTNKGSVFSLVNWERYQDEGQAEGKQRANSGQAKGKPLKEQERENININTLTTFECLSGQSPDAPSRQEDSENESHAGKRPACPVKEIVTMYHDILPEHPRVEIINAQRRGAINARWADIGTRLKATGREDSREARLEYMAQVFRRAARSSFLTGKAVCRDGKTYMATFDMLMRPGGFAGVIEGKYDDRG